MHRSTKANRGLRLYVGIGDTGVREQSQQFASVMA
jgi:hypothetical protein